MAAYGMGLGIFVTSGLSTFVLHDTIYASLRNGYSGPGISIVAHGYQDARRNVADAAAACNLNQQSSRLILDDLTYPFLQILSRPCS